MTEYDDEGNPIDVPDWEAAARDRVYQRVLDATDPEMRPTCSHCHYTLPFHEDSCQDGVR